jgi:predicted ATPase
MSDGTLRSLGVLTALYQSVGRKGGPTPLIAIEEPEATVHPGAAAIIMDALLEASRTEQVIMTTHSPDLLDHEDLDSASILAVRNIDGETILAPIDQASVTSIQDDLFTPGELLRSGQLEPDDGKATGSLRQSDLFERL